MENAGVACVHDVHVGTSGKRASFDNLHKDESGRDRIVIVVLAYHQVSPPDRRDVRVCIRQRQNQPTTEHPPKTSSRPPTIAPAIDPD